MNNDASIVLQSLKLGKIYRDAGLSVPVFDGLDFALTRGEMVAIMGPSGAGKSTLLQLLGGLDQPTAGSVSIMGKQMHDLTEKEKSVLRNQYLGFIYQFHHLLPEFSALENVCIPLWIAKNFNKASAIALLARVGLSHRLHHRIHELSGGERQRVAIARALVNKPACILADEPTGNLDHEASEIVFDCLQTLSREHHASVVMVTHNEALAKRCDRVLRLKKGKLV